MKSIITSIEVQKKNKDRVNIFINNEFSFACSNELIYSHGLKKGLQVEPKSLEEVVKADEYIKGKTAALRYIERAMKTKKQVEDMLYKKEMSEETVSRVIEFLKNYSFIDDKRYAESFIKQKLKESGKNKIKYDLLKKGIDEELIKELLDKVSSEDESTVALALAEKKVRILGKSERDKGKLLGKVTKYLLSKGYTYDLINQVVNKVALTIAEDEEALEEPEVDFEELLALAQKKYNLLKNNEDNPMKLKKKLQDFLLRRGYGYEEIKSVLTQVIENKEDFY